MIPWNEVQANWGVHKANVLRTFDKLTEQDLSTINGDREKLCTVLASRYSIPTIEAMKRVEKFVESVPTSATAAK